MIAQIFLALFGVTAIWLSQDNRPHIYRWASVLGLAGQPFWFYAAYTGEQWGIFVLSIFYTIAWAKGFYIFWIKPKKMGISWR